MSRNLNKKGGNIPMPLDSFGSKLTNIASSITLKNGGAKNNKKGGSIELAPFVASLALLGLRALNDKGIKTKIEKNLGSASVYKSSPKTKSNVRNNSSSKSKSTSRSKTSKNNN